MVRFEDLKGKILTSITFDNEDLFTYKNASEIYLKTADFAHFIMIHHQDCSETVYVEDICGDIKDVLNTPIINAEESTNRKQDTEDYESVTWTFYKIDTIKGGITIRWCGSSNGWYSEGVDFINCDRRYLNNHKENKVTLSEEEQLAHIGRYEDAFDLLINPTQKAITLHKLLWNL